MRTLAGGYNRIFKAKIGDRPFLVEDARFHNMRCTVPVFFVTKNWIHMIVGTRKWGHIIIVMRSVRSMIIVTTIKRLWIPWRVLSWRQKKGSHCRNGFVVTNQNCSSWEICGGRLSWWQFRDGFCRDDQKKEVIVVMAIFVTNCWKTTMVSQGTSWSGVSNRRL